MTAHPERKPDALDLAEALAFSASTLSYASSMLCVAHRLQVEQGMHLLPDARDAANRVLATLDAYEART